MTFTILGSTGFIGGRLRQTLPDAWCPERGDANIFKKHMGHVFYCIGLTNDYKDKPFETVEAHVTLLSRILAEASFDRLVYLSSTRLYDGLTDDACREASDLSLNPANPRHLYDLSKALGENLCLAAGKGRACVARLSSVYDTVPAATGFLPDLLRRLRGERAFTLDSDSGLVRDYIYIDDVVQSLLLLMASRETGIINVASGENVSNQEIVTALNMLGCSITMKWQSPREIRPVCDISKLKALGVSPRPVRSFLQSFLKEQA
jgi:nucleoside-diphosphate-sugar epimerase